MHGFTCGVDDLLIKTDNDNRRKQQLEECEGCGEEVHRNVVGLRKESFIGMMILRAVFITLYEANNLFLLKSLRFRSNGFADEN